MIDGVSIRIQRPCASLQSYVTFFYFVEVRRPVIDFLYPEWANVRFLLSGEWRAQMLDVPEVASREAVLFGPTDRRGLISTQGGRLVGFGLTPLGWHAVVRDDASAMSNRVATLTDQIGGSGEAIRRALLGDADDDAAVGRLEDHLLRRIADQPEIDEPIRRIDAAFRAAPKDVAQFAAAAGVSPRTLQRVCLRTFGFAPKRLLRLQRFLETLGRVRAAVGERVADGIGAKYYDQPQFYRDFRDFMKMTPGEYLAAARQVMAAAAEAQTAAGVTLSFELPPGPDEGVHTC